MNRTPIWLGAVALLAIGARAGAQGVGVEGPSAQEDPRIIARFPASVALRLQSLIDSAANEHLPTEPLFLRALEGGAKRATTEQIVAALTRLRGALRAARGALGPGAASLELSTAATAIQAGLAANRIAELHEFRDGKTVTIPIGAYLDLVARGSEPDRAWSRVVELARRKASDNDFLHLTPSATDVKNDRRKPAPSNESSGGGGSGQ